MAKGVTIGVVDTDYLARGDSPERKAMDSDYFAPVSEKLGADGIASRPSTHAVTARSPRGSKTLLGECERVPCIYILFSSCATYVWEADGDRAVSKCNTGDDIAD